MRGGDSDDQFGGLIAVEGGELVRRLVSFLGRSRFPGEGVSRRQAQQLPWCILARQADLPADWQAG